LLQKLASLLVASAIGLASILPARAQAPYPSHPIRIVVPFGPGGFADITVRLLGQKLTERTGAQVVIENRPGAGGIVAANSVIAAGWPIGQKCLSAFELRTLSAGCYTADLVAL